MNLRDKIWQLLDAIAAGNETEVARCTMQLKGRDGNALARLYTDQWIEAKGQDHPFVVQIIQGERERRKAEKAAEDAARPRMATPKWSPNVDLTIEDFGFRRTHWGVVVPK